MAIVGIFSETPNRRYDNAVADLSRAMLRRHDDISVIQPSPGCWMAESRPRTAETDHYISSSDVVVNIDGCLHNRTELTAALQQCSDTTTDSELIAKAYKLHGSSVFAELIGDWAVAIFDESQRSVILARDYPGGRMLYYSHSSESVIWSTDIDLLLSCDVDREIDDTYLCQRIGCKLRNRTPYRGIVPVEGGTGICFKNGSAQIFRSFLPHLDRTISNATPKELAQSFYTLLRRAIADRLPPGKRYASELSGGFDSSSLVCLADQIWEDSRRDPAELITVTFVSQDPMMKVDDEYLTSVNRHVRFRNVTLDHDAAGFLFPKRRPAFMALPATPPGMLFEFCKLYEREGISLILSGIGGDTISCAMKRPHAILADLWKKRRLWKLQQELRLVSKFRHATIWQLFWEDAVGLSSWIDRQQPTPWLSNMGADRMLEPVDIVDAAPSAILFHSNVESMRRLISLDYYHAIRPAVVSFPFLDRRLVEFMYQVPIEMKAGVQHSRPLFKAALSHTWPPELCRRQSNAKMIGLAINEMRREWTLIEKLLGPDCILARRKIVDLKGLKEAAYGTITKATAFPAFGHVLEALSLEVWLRQLESC